MKPIVKVYVEGGGDYSRLKTLCRKGFRTFFERANFQGHMPQVIACGSRREAFDDFCTALKSSAPPVTPILLVDAEAALLSTGAWDHVLKRAGDHWIRPANAQEEHLHFMVQCMESWFLADRDALRAYFGQGFGEQFLPAASHSEQLAKTLVLESLKNATRKCKTKATYSKGAHSFQILAVVDPRKIELSCPYAKRLLGTLRSLLGAP